MKPDIPIRKSAGIPPKDHEKASRFSIDLSSEEESALESGRKNCNQIDQILGKHLVSV